MFSQGSWVPLDPHHDYGFPLPKQTRYYPANIRKLKIGFGIPLLLVMTAVVVISTIAVLSFRLFMQKLQVPGFTFLGGFFGAIANAITIIILNSVYQKIAIKLTEWGTIIPRKFLGFSFFSVENHRTATEFSNALILKIFVFYFVNSYTSLYYIAFFKSNNRFWNATDLQDGCKYGGADSDIISWGCPDELTVQLATILGTNMIVGQTKEVLLPYLTIKTRELICKKRYLEANDKFNERNYLGHFLSLNLSFASKYHGYPI